MNFFGNFCESLIKHLRIRNPETYVYLCTTAYKFIVPKLHLFILSSLFHQFCIVEILLTCVWTACDKIIKHYLSICVKNLALKNVLLLCYVLDIYGLLINFRNVFDFWRLSPETEIYIFSIELFWGDCQIWSVCQNSPELPGSGMIFSGSG